MYRQGEVYACTDADCGCEITVTQGARQSKGAHDHLCCCGKSMVLKAKK